MLGIITITATKAANLAIRLLFAELAYLSIGNLKTLSTNKCC